MTSKFFTWVDAQYAEPAAVPARIRQHMRDLWLVGVTTSEIARTFSMPVEWVEDFVRRDTGETSVH